MIFIARVVFFTAETCSNVCFPQVVAEAVRAPVAWTIEFDQDASEPLRLPASAPGLRVWV